jgi:hypothetical protein
MINLLRVSSLWLLIKTLMAVPVAAQYSVAPNASVISSPSRSTELYIRLSDDAASMEFTISSFFAVPGTDSLGNFQLFDAEELIHKDASPLIRFSPRRFVLHSGEQQIVRITVASDTLPEGEYWSRIMTSAKLIPDAGLGFDNTVSASIGLEIRTVSGFLYRKGSLSSEIVLDHASTFVRNDSLFVDLEIHKTSAAAWLGTLDAVVSNQSDAVIHTTSIATNAYRAGKYRYFITSKPLEPGVYNAIVTLRSQRDDTSIPIIAAPLVRSVTSFTVEKH